MSNCIECGATNPPSRGNRKRKYCSKKCANHYLHKKNSTRSPGWGDKHKQALKEKEQRRKELEEVINAGWIEYGVLAKQMNITRSGLGNRIKKILQEGVETKKVHDGSPGKNGWRRYVHPDAIDKLKNPYPVPEGHLTSRQAADYLGFSINNFRRYANGHIYGHTLDPSGTIVANGTPTRLYSISGLDKFKQNIENTIRDKQEKEKKLKKEREEKKRAQALEKEKAYQESIKGLLSVSDTMSMLGYKSGAAITRMVSEGSLTPCTIRGGYWFDPEQVKKCVELREEERRLRKESVGRLPDWRYRKDGLEPWERREKRARNYVPHDASPMSVESNKMYWRCHDEGVIYKKTCSKCGEAKPYYMFYLSWKRNASGRSAQCVPCKNLNRKPKKWNNKNESPDKKLRRIFGVTIKRHLSRIKKTYVSDLTQGYIWQKLEENCGYDEKKLVAHIESQFTPEMNWDNYGQLGTSISRDKFCWNIDHIKPKNSFHYTSLNDEEFIECWSLDNLRPLDARLNSIKGDK